MRLLLSLAVLCIGFLAGLAVAQEAVTYRPPDRDFSVIVRGEHMHYLRDGGCAAQADSRVDTTPEPVSAAQCALSKGRTRLQVATAIDGGALER